MSDRKEITARPPGARPVAHNARRIVRGVARITCALAVLLAPAVAGAQDGPGWRWQNPLPQGNDLNGVDFLDADTGWAVGRNGTILRTTDGGAHWAIQLQGEPANPFFGFGPVLYAVQSIDALAVWVVGSDDTVLRTDDGGETWTPQVVEVPGCTGLTYTDVHFVDPAHGWMVGRGSCDGSNRPRLLRTRDAGTTWEVVVPAGLPGGSVVNAFRAIFFADADTGWLASDGSFRTIFRTQDGGDTWTAATTVPANSARSDIVFTDADAGIAVGRDGEIWRTVDGGETWEQRFSGTTEDLNAVAFAATNPGTGCAVGGAVNAGSGVIICTVDGGGTWAVREETDLRLVGVSFGAAPAQETATAVGQLGAILRSGDAGGIWNAQSSAVTRTSLFGVSFPDPDTGWAVGGDPDDATPVIVHTGDGGATWTPQTVEIPDCANFVLGGVHFVDSDSGWAVGSDVCEGVARSLILHTGNGGAHWQVQESGTDVHLTSVHFIDASLGWAAGYGGTVLRTADADAGATWALVETAPSGGTWRDVFFVDENTGWLANSFSSVFRTEDGGDTWLEQTPGISQLRSVFFLDANIGWAVGNGGIAHTADGGASWVLQATAPEGFADVRFVDAEHGIAVGRLFGQILRTADGGTTWTQDRPPRTDEGFAAVAMLDADTATVVGAGGTILRRGEADAPAGGLSLTPDSLDFGEVAIGEIAGPASVTLTSTGTDDVTVSDVTVPGAPFAAADGTCGAPPFTLGPGANCTLDYTFSPTEEGAAEATASVISNAAESPHTFTLRGEGIGVPPPPPGILEIAPAALDFGAVPVGGSGTGTFTVRNAAAPGAEALELATLEVSAGAPVFTLTGGTCQVGTVLPAQSDCTVDVTFHPPNPDLFTGEITVATRDGQTVSIGGPR